MKKLLLLLLLLPSIMGMAETRETCALHKHELRIGWGDPMYETMRWKDETNRMEMAMHARQNYRYTGHFFGEYIYRVNHWFGLGAQVDFGATLFDYNSYCLKNGKQELASSEPRYFYDVCIMPSFRFTYFHSDWVNLYSGLQVGLGVHADYLNRSEFGAAVGVTALGVSVGREHWFGAAEFGGISNIQSLTAIYMLWSRWFTLSVGYRF